MLVEVNLLPEKVKRDITYPLILLLFLLIIAAGTTTLFLYQSKATSKLDELKQELYAVQTESERLREQMVVTTGTDYERLEQAVSELEMQVVSTSLVLDHLVGLLPERGFYLTFDYNWLGTVNFDVSFDRIEEVAAYHQALEQSDLISSISLSIVDTYTFVDEEEFVVSDDEVMPRYIATFALDLQKDNVRKLGDQS